MWFAWGCKCANHPGSQDLLIVLSCTGRSSIVKKSLPAHHTVGRLPARVEHKWFFAVHQAAAKLTAGHMPES